MPIINKNSLDIIMDRRLQHKIDFTALTAKLNAVRPIFGRTAETMTIAQTLTENTEDIRKRNINNSAHHKQAERGTLQNNENRHEENITILTTPQNGR